MSFVIEPAFAKINLYLDIVGKRDDGYHDILSIMQNINLCDIIKITKNENSEIKIICSKQELITKPEENLAYRAAKMFFEEYFVENAGVIIELEKRIPISAGMAGGSADAAATLRALNKLFGNPFSKEKLCEIGKKIGADVPFCIVGGTQIASGIGEKLKQTKGLEHCFIVAACGKDAISTPTAYKKLDERFNNFSNYKWGKGFDELVEYLAKGDIVTASNFMFNVFEEITNENSSVRKIKSILTKHGSKFSMMSGSGPSVFGIFYNKADADNANRDLLCEDITSYVCEPINFID